MSGLTFNGSSTQEMINNAKGEEKKIKLINIGFVFQNAFTEIVRENVFARF